MMSRMTFMWEITGPGQATNIGIDVSSTTTAETSCSSW